MVHDTHNRSRESAPPLLLLGQRAQTVGSLWRGSGPSATSCTDVSQALLALRRAHYAAVLCDLATFESTDLLSRLRAGFPDVASIALANRKQIRRAILAMVSGVSGYIALPQAAETIAERVHTAIARKRLESALLGTDPARTFSALGGRMFTLLDRQIPA